MLGDRFGLQLSTSSTAARDAYVDASERALTFYPGALSAYDSAIAADPRFALPDSGGQCGGRPQSPGGRRGIDCRPHRA